MILSIGEPMRRIPALLVVLTAGLGVALSAVTARAQEEKKSAPPAPQEKKEPAPPAPAAKPEEKPAPKPAAKPEEKPAPKAAAKPAAKGAKAEEKPEETPVTGMLYSVKLKSGRAVRGVIHAKGVWERKDRAQGWVESKREEPGAGLRLWYPSSLDGFLFVPEKQVTQVESLGMLTAEEGRKIARERAEAQSRADGERDRLKTEAEERAAKDAAAAVARAEVSAARKEAGAGKPPATAAGAMVPLDRARRFAELLEKFPPSVWHPDTPKEIERRRLILDLFPTEEEKDFLSVYAEWREAYEFWKQGGGDQAGPAPGGRPAANAKPAK